MTRPVVIGTELVTYLFAPVEGSRAPAAYAHLTQLWETCATGLRLDRPAAGLDVSMTPPAPTDPAHLGAAPAVPVPTVPAHGGMLALRQRPGSDDGCDGVHQAVLRRDAATVSMGVILAPGDPRPTDGTPGGPAGWSPLDESWTALVGDLPSSLLGAARVYQGRVTAARSAVAARPDLAEAAAAALPDAPRPAGWAARGVTTRSGFAVWDLSPGGDGCRERHLLVLAPADADAALSAWTWTGDGTGVPPLLRYLTHDARLRNLVRIWDDGRTVRRFRRRLDDTTTALATGLGAAGLLGSTGQPGAVAAPGGLGDLAARLRVDQFHQVIVATTLREMVRNTEIAADGMRSALRRELAGPRSPAASHRPSDRPTAGSPPADDPFSDDQALAAHLVRQLDDELLFLDTAATRLTATLAVADRHGLGASPAADVRLTIDDRTALLDEIAEVVHEPTAARRMLADVGLPRSRHPYGPANAAAWWRLVFDAFDDGALAAPYQTMLALLTAEYPANRTFTALAARYRIAPAHRPAPDGDTPAGRSRNIGTS